MSAQFEQGICPCGATGIVIKMTDDLWLEFFSGIDFERPETVAGCNLCRVEWARYAGPLLPVAAVGE
jgi:hypothetical protein